MVQHANHPPVGDRGASCLPEKPSGPILFISRDRRLHEEFRALANAAGRMVVRLDRLVAVLAVLKATHPGTVVLDLDLPDQAAWEMAELLLQQRACPPLVLLTGKIRTFEVPTAARSGSLVGKTESPAHLLEIVKATLQLSAVKLEEHNALQRALIGWLRPPDLARSVAPATAFGVSKSKPNSSH